jgi:2-oxo-4-hydroxy-4-carboxy-5-ureidoimidazoline decarboxylase
MPDTARPDTALPVPRADLDAFNDLPVEEVTARLLTCLAVPRWAADVVASRPYPTWTALRARADAAARTLSSAELDAALARHPRIGQRASGGEHDAEFSEREQAGVGTADGETRRRLAEGNAAYERRFDRVFLIRAAGRDATEMLSELERRLGNDDETERVETVDQLREIALLRLADVIR